MKKNITLIGMPGSGKSTHGKFLAKELNFDFIDGDDYIEEKEQMSLQQIIDSKEDQGFLDIEEKRLLEILSGERYVFAPGGSVIYLGKLMDVIKSSSVVVFLNEPFQVIKKRLTDKKAERIIGLKKKTLEELYAERNPLYIKYADITIDCLDKSTDKIVDEIIEKVKNI